MRSSTALLAAVLILAAVSQAWAWTVPGTGITACYDNTGEIPCPASGEAFYGQNGNFPGTAHVFVESADTATDQATGLVWQKTPDGVARGQEAAATYCASLDLGGQTDWRLPAQRELTTIIDYARSLPAFAPPLAGASGHYWSSTAYLGYAGPVWHVNFAYGVSEWGAASDAKNVRCVRGQVLAGPSYQVSGQVVTDAATGRIWEKTGSAAAMAWQEALAYCQASATGGYSDWRLPDVMELRTLADYARYDPALDGTVFSSAGYDTWSGSTLAGHPELSWRVDFASGSSASEAKTTSRFVRCVRTPPSPTQDPANLLLLLLQEQ